ncbi:glycerophosphodiester phosphodiesterase [Virgibacillus kekensis]|uniref:Glycerophosphodiester phosphodiesterase n=1 Tax=Virgibacillus kekensis TaxID=202261 RepID=A0ABV9DGJ7_9BACI
MTKIFAHRGSAGTHPENTMASYREAKRVGADGIELDVHLTSDGKLAVIHDETVDRTTNGTGHIKDFTLAELKELDAGSWFTSEFSGETIPELGEVLAWVKQEKLLVNIELKNVFYLDYPGIEENVLQEVNRYGLKEQTVISSFNHIGLNTVRRLDSEIDCAILYSEKLYQPWNYAKTLGSTSLHPHLYGMNDEMIQYAEQIGCPVRPFTINEEQQIEKFIRLGCSAIITDFPERAVILREAISR